MIDIFATRFGLDPDFVYLKSFGTVTAFLIKWYDEAEIRDRVNELDRIINGNPTKPA